RRRVLAVGSFLRRLAELPLASDRELLLELGDTHLKRRRVLSLERQILAREVDDALRELLILAIEDLRRLTEDVDVLLVLESRHAAIINTIPIVSIHPVRFSHPKRTRRSASVYGSGLRRTRPTSSLPSKKSESSLIVHVSGPLPAFSHGATNRPFSS